MLFYYKNASRRPGVFNGLYGQLGGRCGLTVFPFDTDPAAEAILAAFLTAPHRNPDTGQVQRSDMAAALATVVGPWPGRVVQALCKAAAEREPPSASPVAREAADANGVSFEDLIEAMEESWESREAEAKS